MAGIPLTRTGPESGGNYESQWRGEFLHVHLLSDIGRKRTRNEDACLMCAPEDKDLAGKRGYLFAVADGMGGVSGGEFASKAALQKISEGYFAGRGTTITARLREAVQQANQHIFEEAENNPNYYGMGTTVSAVLIHGDCAYVAQVGDSRVYMSHSDGSVQQITDDHSLVAEQVRNGYISEEEAQTHALKNLITRAVGTKEKVKVDLFWTRLNEGDTILICSDGLTNMVQEPEIAESLTLDSVQGVARVLIGRALNAGGADNITAIVIRVTGHPPKTEIEGDAIKIAPKRPWPLRVLRKLIS